MKEIPLTKGRIALVDDEDYEWAMQWCWCACGKPGKEYAMRGTGNLVNGVKVQRFIYLHREILRRMGKEGHSISDHHDRNRMNNRRYNLRPSDFQKNLANASIQKRNTSGFKGVSWCKSRNKWVAQIHSREALERKKTFLGYFDDPAEAGKAYAAVAKKDYGEEFLHAPCSS